MVRTILKFIYFYVRQLYCNCIALGVGNITQCAEYNFYEDPEAVSVVLDTFTCPIVISPWEPCLKEHIDMSIVPIFEINNFHFCEIVVKPNSFYFCRTGDSICWALSIVQ